MKDLIKWIINKNKIEEEIETQDRIIDNQKARIAKQALKELESEKELEYLRASNEKYILKIKELRKEIRNLKKGNNIWHLKILKD